MATRQVGISRRKTWVVNSSVDDPASAAILARLEEDLQRPDITDCFDLIVGTSTVKDGVCVARSGKFVVNIS